jgi:hypothetical protein
MYVSIKPAIILESDPAEKVKRNPKKTETPLKYGRIASWEIRKNYD